MYDDNEVRCFKCGARTFGLSELVSLTTPPLILHRTDAPCMPQMAIRTTRAHSPGKFALLASSLVISCATVRTNLSVIRHTAIAAKRAVITRLRVLDLAALLANTVSQCPQRQCFVRLSIITSLAHSENRTRRIAASSGISEGSAE